MDGAAVTLRDVTTEEFRRSARVLDKGETRRDRLWKECVAEARQLVRTNDSLRLKVVELANKCCVIHHGGSQASERYTVKKFADEIGITYRTLIEWMRMKKNIYDNLPPEKVKGFTYTDLVRIDRALVGTPRDKNYAKRVQATFKKIENTHPVTLKLEKYNKHLTSICFNVENPRMLKGADDAVLAEMLHLARRIVVALKHVDTKTKASR